MTDVAFSDAHAIYLLNLLLAFLQPRFDPSLEADLTADELEEGGPDEYVPPSQQQKDDEFRPFIRRLPEWNFWYVCVVVPPSLFLPSSQAVHHAGDPYFSFLHHVRGIRRPRLLADPRMLLLCSFLNDDAATNPVREPSVMVAIY